MKGDFTRSTFRRGNHYSSVRLQQGSVMLDADINEAADIEAYIERTTNGDVIGLCGAPFHAPGTFQNFAIQLVTGGTDLRIAPGRIYVDGILCENDSSLEYLKQTDLPEAKLPDKAGNYMAFLDVWERLIAPVDQYADAFPPIREAALGGPDTADRHRVVWQVKLASIDGAACDKWVPPVKPTGRLRADTEPPQPGVNDCLVPAGGGYRRLENQLYRVEIHDGSGTPKPRFKWSRDNGCMVSRVKATDQAAAVITIEDPGRDDVIGFASARWVELSDEERTLNGLPGLLLEVDTVTGTTIKLKNPTNASLTSKTNPVLRRWDGVGDLVASKVTSLEDGVRVEFDNGTFASGDFWMVPARTLTGRVEWPGTTFETRHGTLHHYCPLAVVTFGGPLFSGTPTDCRKLFPPLTAIKASDVSYNPAACANLANTKTVQEAIDKLCQSTGGSEPGIHVKGVSLMTGEPLQNDTLVSIKTFAGGIRVTCDDQLFQDSVRNDRGLPNPVCLVTVELPWPLIPIERELWAVSSTDFLGFQAITLAGQVNSDNADIFWTPTASVKKWLADRLLQVVSGQTQGQLQRVMARLTLKGNYIWGPTEAPKLYLDGEVFGIPGPKRTLVSLPSGNGRRGGDLEMWFWLALDKVSLGVIPGKTSKFFQTTSGAQALNFAIDRKSTALAAVLPTDYVVDASQTLDPAKAATLARDTGVARLSLITPARFDNLTKELSAMVTKNTKLPVDVVSVPDAELVERVRKLMVTGAIPPDMVIGDDTIATQLTDIGYTGAAIIRL